MSNEGANGREQAKHDEARACLARMRERTEAATAAAGAATEVDSVITEWTLRHRLRSLDDDPAGVFFGCIDDGTDEFYVGRRHIERSNGEAFVIDWRVPAATPFYRATWADPMDLRRRKRHSIEDHRVVAVFDEDFEDEDAVAGGGGVPDPLLAELERARSGSMRDIVATIQTEQDRVIRAPLEGTIVVQGGPGTGKTAVGLHRAAYLLYDQREILDREGVLVVGPNQRFLRYISQVLPSLGEHAVTQLTVDGVASTRRTARRLDDDNVAEAKGSAAMVEVIEALVTDAITPAAIEVPLGHRVVRLTEEEVASLMGNILASGTKVNLARDGFANQAATAALKRRHGRHSDEIEQLDELRGLLRGSAEWKRQLDRIWPNQSSVSLLRRFYSNRSLQSRVSTGVLDATATSYLHRTASKKVADEMWTSADLVLLDEIEHRLNGTPMSYGHIVIDEAQDLSTMALRMVKRRAGRDSITVLGDLAQSTRPGGQTSWEDALEHLCPSGHGQLMELKVGYRLPTSILNFASRLLPTAAPTITPSRSVREGGSDPSIVEVARGDLNDLVLSTASSLAGVFETVGILTPPLLESTFRDVMRAAGFDIDAEDASVVILEASLSKGLEFDAVVVVEPAAIVSAHRHGLRVLYVAMTRAVQQLHLVHSAGLPTELNRR